MHSRDLVAIGMAAAAACARPPSSAATLLAKVNHRVSPDERIRLLEEASFGVDGHVAKFRFPNGLKVIVSEDHGAPVFSYHTWFRVGSRNERTGKTGLAHLFEHLMFNETENLRAGEFDRVLEKAGGESNAATWVDFTYYYENLPAAKLDLAVRLEADRMQHLVLQDPQVASEKEVVANERRYSVDDNIEGSLNELLYRTAFTRHPYHWPTIGWMSDIEAFNTADCHDFYRTYYAPNNATIVVVGDVDTARLLRILRRHYGSIPSQDMPRRRLPVEPEQDEQRRLTVEKPVSADKLQMGWHGPSMANPEHAALTVGNEVLFGGRSSRLYRSLVTRLEIATSARGWVSTFADPGLYEVFVELREGHRAAEAERVVQGELARFRRDLVPEAELAKAKNRLELQFLQGLSTSSGRAEQFGFYETTLGDFREVFTRLDALRAVTADDVRRAARRYLRRTNRTVIVAIPERSPSARPTAAAEEQNGE